MEEIVEIVINTALFIIVAYPIILLFIADNEDDDFFSFFDGNIKEEKLLNQIRKLGKLNNVNYDSQLKQFHLFYSDNKLSDREYKEIDKFITLSYFNSFEDRWVAYRKADLVLLMVCGFSIIAALVSIAMIVFSVDNVEDLNTAHLPTAFVLDTPTIIGFSLLGIGLLYLFTLLFLGIYSMLFSMFSLMFPRKGNLVRRAYILDEMIKSLKPGGRFTPVFLGASNVSGNSNEMMYVKAMLMNKNRKKP